MSPTVCTAVNSQNRAFSPTTPSSLTIQAGSPAKRPVQAAPFLPQVCAMFEACAVQVGAGVPANRPVQATTLLYVYTRSPSPLSPVHCAIATVFVALPKALSKLGFAL